MQKWEYLRIQLDFSGGHFYVHFIGGEELTNWTQGPKVSEYLNNLGDQGWELISDNVIPVGYDFTWLDRTHLDNTKRLEEVYEIARDNKNKGAFIESITSFSWGATGSGGGWLFYSRYNIRVLLFKRPKE
jgi:hypothetical protein